MTPWHQVINSDPNTDSHEDLPAIGGTHLTIQTSDQKPQLRRTDACGRACRRLNLTEKCGSPNPRRAERGTTPSTRVVPPRWRNNIAVVDNGARARLTQARLNLALETGRSSTWHAGSWCEGGRLRPARTARRARSFLSPNFFVNPEEKLPAISIFLFHASRFDVWPRFLRPPPFPLSLASSPKFVSAIALSAPPE